MIHEPDADAPAPKTADEQLAPRFPYWTEEDNLRAMADLFPIQRVIEALGVDAVIEAIGRDRLLEAVIRRMSAPRREDLLRQYQKRARRP